MLGRERGESLGRGLCVDKKKRIKCTEERLALDRGVTIMTGGKQSMCEVG